MKKHTKIIDAIDGAKYSKWSWPGHVQRMNEDWWAKVVEKWTPDGKRSTETMAVTRNRR